MKYPQGIHDYDNFKKLKKNQVDKERILKNHKLLTEYFKNFGYKNNLYRLSINTAAQELKTVKENFFCKYQLSFAKKLKEYVMKYQIEDEIRKLS